jgi:L-fucose dehydrogenase
MNLELDSKVILVVGGARGLGASVVTALAEEGAVPFILDREGPSKELLSRTGAPVQTVELGDSTACEAAIHRVAARFGHIDGLVNVAGDGRRPLATDPLLASVTRSLACYDQMTRLCLPHLRRTHGAIVSIADHPFVEPDAPGYVALKTGVLGLTREWAAAFAGDGVRVNAVIPARMPVQQPSNRRASTRRRFSPREAADMIVFLLSARAGLTTGQWLYVDGGYVHREPVLV